MGHALIFDSGVGGLSVVEEIRRLMPNMFLSYVADDEFRPYGGKPETALRARLPQLLSELCIMLNPDIVVIACNTASTTALGEIRAALTVPVIGVVPAIKPAAKLSRTKTIAVLGTPGTVRRQYVDDLIEEFAADCQVITQGSVNLVQEAEKKLSGEAVDYSVIKKEIAPMFRGRKGADVDAVVLACTHFPLLKDELESCTNQTLFWVDSGEAIARRVMSVMAKLEVNLRPRGLIEETVFLIGPHACPARQCAFKAFGFKSVIGLVPKKMPIEVI